MVKPLNGIGLKPSPLYDGNYYGPVEATLVQPLVSKLEQRRRDLRLANDGSERADRYLTGVWHRNRPGDGRPGVLHDDVTAALASAEESLAFQDFADLVPRKHSPLRQRRRLLW